jgi:phosphate:Na+ symporter
MDLFNLFSLLGGLALFLFGMDIMGKSLERKAGSKLRVWLERFTTGRIAGFFSGMAITALIQSSSATTVMVVGFVNSGLMSLKQAINVIMGANVGTTVTAWLLSLAGISSANFLVQMFKPSNFTPLLAFIGIILYQFCKSEKKKDTGMILLGFAVLMTGMELMSGAVSGLKNEVWFHNLFIMFENPLLGVLAGALLTAVIQSSSASVGILQALATSGQVTYGAAIPIIMGQNIGTCVTALISSINANKNGKRAALVHLTFNIMGTVVLLAAFWGIQAALAPAFLSESASLLGIAIFHTVFNVLCTLIILPFSRLLEKIVYWIVPDEQLPYNGQENPENVYTV